MWRQLGFIFNPKSPQNPFFTFLIMHYNTVALDSVHSSQLAYLLRPASTFPFPYLFEVHSSLCISDICTQSHLNCHSNSFLIGLRRALADPRESRGLTVSSLASQSSHQNTTLSKTVSPLTLKVHSALVGLVRC